jgi:hypothetical protein
MNYTQASSYVNEMISIRKEFERMESHKKNLVKRYKEIEQQVIQYLDKSKHDNIQADEFILSVKTATRKKPLGKKDRKQAIAQVLSKQNITPDDILGSIRSKEVGSERVLDMKRVKK